MSTWMELLLALVFIGLLLAVVDLGRWLAGRHLERGPEHAVDAGTIQGAMLGLLALLLGFSFGGASSRYVERQDLVVADASAIQSAWLRADLLAPADRDALRAELQTYLDHRLQFSADRGAARSAELQDSERRLDRLWSITVNASAEDPETRLAVAESVDALFDVFDQRVSAAEKHLPIAILVLLVVCSLLTLMVIGYSGRLSGHRRTMLTRVLAALIALALLSTVDMDHGRIGLIRVSEAPLQRLAEERLEPDSSPIVGPGSARSSE